MLEHFSDFILILISKRLSSLIVSHSQDDTSLFPKQQENNYVLLKQTYPKNPVFKTTKLTPDFTPDTFSCLKRKSLVLFWLDRPSKPPPLADFSVFTPQRPSSKLKHLNVKMGRRRWYDSRNANQSRNTVRCLVPDSQHLYRCICCCLI